MVRGVVRVHVMVRVCGEGTCDGQGCVVRVLVMVRGVW